MHAFVRASFASAVFGFASVAMADTAMTTPATAPDPNTVYVGPIHANGSGCPAGTASGQVTPDGLTLSITYGQFVAEIGPGVSPGDWRKNCLLNFVVHVPQGFSYAVVSADHRGYAQLQPGVIGKQTADYYISGQLSSVRGTTKLVGDSPDGYDDTFFRRDEVAIANLVWSPCGVDSIGNINASVSVNNTNAPLVNGEPASGTMAQDATDINVQEIYHFQWRKCVK